MRRYWKIITLVPFIILCIGTYYVTAASGQYPNYYLKLHAGDEKEASTVTLPSSYTNQYLNIGSQGSKYQSELPFWEWLALKNNRTPEMAKLHKEHRQFMRGKNSPASFYEDEAVLAYVDIISQKGGSDFRFIVSLYDKKVKTSSSFEVKVPMGGNYQTIGLTDVQIAGQRLKLVTTNSKSIGSNAAKSQTYPEIHLYSLDLTEKNIKVDQVIVSGVSSDSNKIEIRPVYGTDLTKQSHYAVFQKSYTKLKKTSETYELYVAYKRELLFYDYDSGEIKIIRSDPLDAVLQQLDEMNIRHIKDDIWVTVMSDPKEVRVIRYNLTTNKLVKVLTINTNKFHSNGRKMTSSIIANNRLYMMGSLKHGTSGEAPTLVIADLDKGGILYEGYISRKDNKDIRNLMTGLILVQ